MDINAVYSALVEAIEASDIDAVTEHWSNLNEWLSKGGFAPKQWDPAQR